MTARAGTVLIFSIHNSEPWWREVGRNLGYEHVRLVTDLRGEGDVSVVDGFYAAYRRFYRAAATESVLLSADEIADVVARCRVLRWYPIRRAAAMALAMAEAMDRVLDDETPVAVLSWPIDRYVKDVLARMAARRRTPYFELTAGPVPGTSMLVLRGQLLTRDDVVPSAGEIDAAIHAIADPLFVPAYIPSKARYTRSRFLRTIGYFALRSVAFQAISWWKRDPLNLHYMDAQFSLGHKPRLRDIRMLRLIDRDWRERMETFPKDRRLFIALQLFPEASIDYWIRSLELIDHDEILVAAAQAFSAAGYVIVVKDHPLQFGFRQISLIERLRAIPNVVIVPYDVPGNALLAEVGASFTETGTLGMQAALTGMKSITVEAYYYTPGDYIPLRGKADIPDLPARLAATPAVDDLRARQERIVSHLLKGSFPGDFMSFRGFDAARPDPAIRAFAGQLGTEIAVRVG
ncbi:hypothetical protein [Sphingomonas sp.]|uniref:capsular polysaccharide export protein, LipB/KpsS family n=1 Tax=Sphingomonas sp. TaxID=28214 RepID=UPI0035BC33F0